METYVQTLEITLDDLTRSLDAMLWVINPYLDDGTLPDHPWILELAEAYNTLALLVPDKWTCNYPVISLT